MTPKPHRAIDDARLPLGLSRETAAAFIVVSPSKFDELVPASHESFGAWNGETVTV